MANQSSYRSNRPGYANAGRSMSGQNRSMSGSGCTQPHRPTPYSGRAGSGRSMYDMNRDRIPRSGQGSNRDRSSSDCPCDEMCTQPADNMCEQKRDNGCDRRDGKSVTCVTTADFPVGMAYVPMQMWEPLYDHQKALCQGTLFPELDKPFMGGRAAR